jgi:hypothetical protein
MHLSLHGVVPCLLNEEWQDCNFLHICSALPTTTGIISTTNEYVTLRKSELYVLLENMSIIYYYAHLFEKYCQNELFF